LEIWNVELDGDMEIGDGYRNIKKWKKYMWKWKCRNVEMWKCGNMVLEYTKYEI
jgi:hypothetical protein